MAELILVAAEFAEVLEQATITYEAIDKVRKCARLSKDLQHQVDLRRTQLNDAQEAADETGWTCMTCASLTSELDTLIKERVAHTKDAVKWAASGRDAQREMKEKRVHAPPRVYPK